MDGETAGLTLYVRVMGDEADVPDGEGLLRRREAAEFSCRAWSWREAEELARCFDQVPGISARTSDRPGDQTLSLMIIIHHGAGGLEARLPEIQSVILEFLRERAERRAAERRAAAAQTT
jgi:hypothetical protein